MSTFSILFLFLSVVTTSIAGEVSTDPPPVVPLISATPTSCPSSTFADCTALIDIFWKRRRENPTNVRDICGSYKEIIECYKSLKVDIACQEDLQLSTDLMVTNARINECEVHDVHFMVDASKDDGPTSCRNTIAVAAFMIIVIIGIFVFAFRYSIKKCLTHVKLWP